MISSVGHTLNDIREVFFAGFGFDTCGSIQDVVNIAEANALGCDVVLFTAFCEIMGRSCGSGGFRRS